MKIQVDELWINLSQITPISMGIFVVTFLHRSVFTQILGGPLPYENLPMMSEAVGAGSQKIVMSEDVVFGFVFDCPRA